jgi:hypothetical protein
MPAAAAAAAAAAGLGPQPLAVLARRLRLLTSTRREKHCRWQMEQQGTAKLQVAAGKRHRYLAGRLRQRAERQVGAPGLPLLLRLLPHQRQGLMRRDACEPLKGTQPTSAANPPLVVRPLLLLLLLLLRHRCRLLRCPRLLLSLLCGKVPQAADWTRAR